jgi:phosphocarrier protein
MEREITVKHEHGLHARPADLFVRTANRFQSNIQVVNITTGSSLVNAKSIIRILGLGVCKDHTIRLIASGDDEAEALTALTDLIDNNFN